MFPTPTGDVVRWSHLRMSAARLCAGLVVALSAACTNDGVPKIVEVGTRPITSVAPARENPSLDG